MLKSTPWNRFCFLWFAVKYIGSGTTVLTVVIVLWSNARTFNLVPPTLAWALTPTCLHTRHALRRTVFPPACSSPIFAAVLLLYPRVTAKTIFIGNRASSDECWDWCNLFLFRSLVVWLIHLLTDRLFFFFLSTNWWLIGLMWRKCILFTDWPANQWVTDEERFMNWLILTNYLTSSLADWYVEWQIEG